MCEIKGGMNALGALLLSEESLAVEICENELDFSKVCRTCLCETADNDLGNETLCIISSSGKLVRVHEMFEVATGLKIESNDNLPHHICSACLKLVNSLYSFRTQSQRADDILRSILGSVKIVAIHPPDESPPELNLEEAKEKKVELDATKESEAPVDECENAPVDESNADDFSGFEVMEIEQLEEITELDRTAMAPAHYFPCQFCGKIYDRQRDIYQHYKAKHPKEKPFKCDECSSTFSHVQSLRRHSTTHEESSKKKPCPICHRLFNRTDDLKRHIRTHTDERPYPCPLCHKAFKQHTERKDHMLSHYENKTYKCAICEKEWRSRNGWYLHMKSHQGVKVQRKKNKKKPKRNRVVVESDDTTDE